MSTALQQAINTFCHEVDAEAIKLIERGFPPYDAIDKARSIVSDRRRRRSEPAHSNGDGCLWRTGGK